MLQVAARKADADRESRRRDRLEKEARELRALLESRQSDIAARNIQVRGWLLLPACAGPGCCCCCYSSTVAAAAAAGGCAAVRP